VTFSQWSDLEGSITAAMRGLGKGARGERYVTVQKSFEAFGPLAGIRVLEFSQIVAGPVAGLNLADLGADVIKVEPPSGDSHRFVGTTVPGESKMYQGNNRGKRGLVIDLHDPRGIDAILRIVPTVDVVIMNYRPGVAARLGMDFESLKSLRPDLIYAQISGFGESGPWSTRGGSDIVAQAYSGLMVSDEKYDEHGSPQLIGVPVSDYAAGFAIAMAVCAALLHRERTGNGQYVSTSLFRMGLFMLNRAVMREPISDAAIRDPMVENLRKAQSEGATFPELVAIRNPRGRIASPFTLYYCAYQAADGIIVLGALTPQNRAHIRAVLGIEGEHSDDPDFDARDPKNIAEINRWKLWIEHRLRERPVAHWLAEFERVGVPAARVNFPEEMADDEQARADGLIVDLEHLVTGPQRVVGPAVTMSGTPTGSPRPAPALGQHTAEVLREAGMSSEEIAALARDGVVRIMS
jgi:crotonobetainyl-CoA:carnitine CoA-transferase CaiB-like acyl-CoA transferase